MSRRAIPFVTLLLVSGGVLAEVVTSGGISFTAPSVTDSNPIIQGSDSGLSGASFPGQLYTDPVYRICAYDSGWKCTAPLN